MNFLDFSNYDTDTWLAFLQENWYVILIALIVIMLIIRVMKTMVKWAIILVVAIGVIVYSGYTLDDVKNLSTSLVSSGIEELKEIGSKVADSAKEEAINAMVGEAASATYTTNDDGTFTVKTTSITLTGQPGSDEVSISVKGAPAFKVKSSAIVTDFIKQAEANSK
ncbi:MAG: hypothetical protein NAG76_00790 [Candidatus Pristimantibacillus lignocellulolyticus]|uniref:Uncharacterized protein n=1 Tax=Candidatus Pristimantibacillus lignocellulolyticus TaxID=2994561 RepID=A0A9J6ZFA3_9BACL|nr:MAG: hypothetical protein NAG76_00790 [Candidatus Pristimantibacillus lignocellulolyticus]